MKRSGFRFSCKILLTLFFVINCLLVKTALAQETCDIIYNVVSLSDTFKFETDVIVRADIPENQTKVIGCINVQQSGFYRINSVVSYSNSQDNESYYFQVCDKQTSSCKNPCNPNLGPFNVVVDKTDVADTTVRNAGTFYLAQGDNIVTVTHYAKIAYEFPRFINGPDSIDGAQSVHMKAIVVDFVDEVFDVEVRESANISRVNPGEEYQYRLAVKNVEKSGVYFVNLKNALPPYVTPISYSLPPASFDSDTLFWVFDSLASGDSIIVDVDVRVDDSPPIRPFDLVNKAWVTGSCDMNPINGLDSSVVVILPPIFYDLEVKNTTITDSLFRGQDVTFEIQLKNSGPDTAVNISIVDLADQNLSFLDSDFQPQRITPDSIYWQVDTLAVGDSVKIKVFARVNATGFTVPAEVLNKVIIESENDINSVNDEATATVKVVPRRADLSVTKSADQDSIYKERSFNYSITVQNTGPDTATNIVLRDFMPANLIVQSVTPEAASILSDTVLWQIDTLAVNETREFTIGAKVDTSKIGAPLTLLNRVEVEGEVDPDITNNQDSAVVNIIPRRYDLSLEKTTNRDSIFKEQSYSYRITVENAGPDTASHIIVKDVKPDNIIAFSYEPPPVKIVGDSIFWRIDSLAAMERQTFTVGAKVDTSKITVPTVLTNVAIVESENDTNPGNNEDTAIVKVVPRRYDLSVKKTSSQDSIFKEHSYSYELMVENLGPDTALDITLTDIKPDNIIAFSYDPAPVKTVGDSSFWHIDSLAIGERRTFTVGARADTNKIVVPAELTNVAIIESENDSNPLNNEDTAIVKVVPRRYDLSLVKTASRDSIFKEHSYSYRITVESVGPDTASNITVMDIKSDNIIAFSYEPPPVKIVGDSIFWRIDSLAAMERQIFTVGAKADTSKISVPTVLTNVAIVESKNDTNPNNNKDTALVKVVPRRYDLSVKKNSSQDSIFKEHSYNYRITVENAGPDTASHIIVKDIKPDNIIAFSYEPPPVKIVGDSIFWHIDSLAAMERQIFTVGAKADTSKISVPTVLTNVAIVESKNDTNPNNNKDTALVKVVPRRYDLSVKKTSSQDSIFKEHSYSYRITVENVGPDTASNITVMDIKSDNIIAFSYEPPPVKIVGDSIFWHIDSLAAMERQTFTVGAKADTSKITVPTVLTNVAVVESGNDTNPNNNEDTALVKVVPRRYDIQITKTASADSVFPGQGFGYTLSILNAGPDTASSVQVKDVVPDLAALLEFEPQPQRITPDSVFWDIMWVAPNETLTLDIQARADSGKLGLPRLITNTGMVFSKRDINSSNDLSTVTNYIVRKRSDLQIIKSASIDSVDEGGTFAYSLLVENIGRDVAERIVLWDLPSPLTPTSDFSLSPDYTQQDTLFWLFDSLSAGDFFEIEYAAQAPDSVPTTPFEIPSFASIFAENDINSRNDFSQSIIIIRPQNDCIVFDRNVLIPQRGERLEIEFELSTGRQVEIDIYDVSGYRIGNLRKEFFAPGLHSIEWDGKNRKGLDVGSGTYLITFKSGGLICYKKIIVVH